MQGRKQLIFSEGEIDCNLLVCLTPKKFWRFQNVFENFGGQLPGYVPSSCGPAQGRRASKSFGIKHLKVISTSH